MGPAMGKPGLYVQSDMQFVQKVQDEIRQFPHGEGPDHIIPPQFNMALFARFFVNDQKKEAVMTASELHINYSPMFVDFLEDQNIAYYHFEKGSFNDQ